MERRTGKSSSGRHHASSPTPHACTANTKLSRRSTQSMPATVYSESGGSPNNPIVLVDKDEEANSEGHEFSPDVPDGETLLAPPCATIDDCITHLFHNMFGICTRKFTKDYLHSAWLQDIPRAYNDNGSKESLRRQLGEQLEQYIATLKEDCPFKVQLTSSYSEEPEACVMASREIKKGPIKYLCGLLFRLTSEEEKLFENENRDFSILRSIDGKSTLLLVGPARFSNHDCEANATLKPTKGSRLLQIIAERRIDKGEEITVKYSGAYFGKDNRECRCRSCALLRPSGQLRNGPTDSQRNGGRLLEQSTTRIVRSSTSPLNSDYIPIDVEPGSGLRSQSEGNQQHHKRTTTCLSPEDPSSPWDFSQDESLSSSQIGQLAPKESNRPSRKRPCHVRPETQLYGAQPRQSDSDGNSSPHKKRKLDEPFCSPECVLQDGDVCGDTLGDLDDLDDLDDLELQFMYLQTCMVDKFREALREAKERRKQKSSVKYKTCEENERTSPPIED